MTRPKFCRRPSVLRHRVCDIKVVALAVPRNCHPERRGPVIPSGVRDLLLRRGESRSLAALGMTPAPIT